MLKIHVSAIASNAYSTRQDIDAVGIVLWLVICERETHRLLLDGQEHFLLGRQVNAANLGSVWICKLKVCWVVILHFEGGYDTLWRTGH